MAQDAEHEVILQGRQQLRVTGVKHVAHYDDSRMILETTMGILVLEGQGFNINQLDLQAGELQAQGTVKSLDYQEGEKSYGKGGLWQRWLK